MKQEIIMQRLFNNRIHLSGIMKHGAKMLQIENTCLIPSAKTNKKFFIYCFRLAPCPVEPYIKIIIVLPVFTENAIYVRTIIIYGVLKEQTRIISYYPGARKCTHE